MTRQPLRVLIVEDSEDDAELIAHALRRGGFEPSYRRVEAEQDMREAVAGDPWDIVLVDFELPSFDVLAALKILEDCSLDLPLIVISGVISMDRAVTLMKAGAHDFVEKDDLARLVPAVERELREADFRRRRREVEEELEASREATRLLLECAGEGIFGIDLEGNCTFANAECLRLLGYDDVASLLDRNMHELSHHTRPDGRPYPEDDCLVFRAFRGDGGIYCNTEVLWRADGTSFPAEYRAFPILRDGEVIGAVVTFSDITELKKAEQQLREAQKMEVVGQLTGGVAHDFNNLMAIILGNLEMLQKEVEGNAKAQQRVDDALHAVFRGRDLTYRLLAFSRRQTLLPEVTDINALVRRLIEILERTLGETIEIHTELAEDLWPAVADRSQLETALLNLAVNGRDAMPEGGRMTIETAAVNLDRHYAAHNEEVRAGEYAMIALSDTGAGMAPEVVEIAFEPFFTTKGVGEGSGLGLSMVYGFVKQSGGHIKLYSEPGLGTTVKLYLPRATSESGLLEPTCEPDFEARGRGERILVVEDESKVRRLVTSLLEDLGYQVVETPDGQTARTHLSEGPPIDLLLTDLVLPGGLGGERLADEARALYPGLAVLYITGYTGKAALRNGALRGATAILSKPFEMRSLASRVRGLLDQRSAWQSVGAPV